MYHGYTMKYTPIFNGIHLITGSNLLKCKNYINVVYILLGRIIVFSLSILVILHASTHIIVYFYEFLIFFSLCISLTFLIFYFYHSHEIILLPLSRFSCSHCIHISFYLDRKPSIIRNSILLSLPLFFFLFLSFLVDIFFSVMTGPDRYVHFTIIL